MNTHQLFSIHRPSLSPCVDIPFGVRSCGHYRVGGDFKDSVFSKPFVQVFWCIKGSGAIVIDGTEHCLEAQQIAVYYSNAEHQIYGTGTDWEYRWVTFDGSLADSTVRSFGFSKEGVYSYNIGEADLQSFEQLENDLRNVTPSGESKACATAFQLLIHSSAQLSKQHTCNARQNNNKKTIKHALEYIHKNWNDPMVGVEQISIRLKIHRSRFSKLFLTELGITPKDYTTRIRVQYALSKLKQSQDTIKNIPKQAGWEDPNCFSRCIKTATGVSPSQYRIQNTVVA